MLVRSDTSAGKPLVAGLERAFSARAGTIPKFITRASLARGGWLKAGETPAVSADRDATVLTIESELAFRYTRLLGEWTRDRLDTDAGAHVASGWFLQAQQTLAPLAAEFRALTPLTLADLREVDFGEWTGHTWEQVLEKFGAHAFD